MDRVLGAVDDEVVDQLAVAAERLGADPGRGRFGLDPAPNQLSDDFFRFLYELIVLDGMRLRKFFARCNLGVHIGPSGKNGCRFGCQPAPLP